MSGRRSASTRTGTQRSFIVLTISGTLYVVASITAHPRHHEAPIASSTGLRSRAARSNGAGPQEAQATPPDGRERSVARSTKLSDIVGVAPDTHRAGPAGRPDLSL